MYVNEICGAESYSHGERWMYVGESKNELINEAKSLFMNEHSNECNDCEQGIDCEAKMISELKKDNRSEIYCGTSTIEYINLEIISKIIT